MTCTHPVPVHLEDNLRESPPSRSNSKAGSANAHVGHRLKLPDVRQFVPPARAMAISQVQPWWTLWIMLWQTNMALEGLDKSRAVLDGEAQAPVVISDRIRARLTPLLASLSKRGCMARAWAQALTQGFTSRTPAGSVSTSTSLAMASTLRL